MRTTTLDGRILAAWAMAADIARRTAPPALLARNFLLSLLAFRSALDGSTVLILGMPTMSNRVRQVRMAQDMASHFYHLRMGRYAETLVRRSKRDTEERIWLQFNLMPLGSEIAGPSLDQRG
ncbi:hypothetical protein XI01_05010 [Bradyrhizobium sp. CCBAU 21360]|nr:hypothetical protein [Bradyrhizobium sp. CCBAU 21360]